MMLLFLLLACGPKPVERERIQADRAALEARVAALEKENQELSDRLEGIEARQETWDTLLTLAERSMNAILQTAGPGTQAEDTAPSPAVPGCRLVEEGRYRLDASFRDVELAGLAREARVLLHHGADGAVDGYRLAGIRRGKPAYSCGFRNGDVLHALGEHPLTTPAEAWKAFQALENQPEVDVVVTRRLQTLRWVIELPQDTP